MNRATNILLMFFAFPAMAYTIFVAFDVPLEMLHISMGSFEHRDKIFLVFALIFLILIVRRSVSRWAGVNMTRKPERFLWSVKVGKERKKNVRLFLIIEMLFAGVFALGLLWLTPESWPIAVAFGVMFLDQLIFMLVAPRWFRVGIAQQAIVVTDRELRLIYYSGLRRVDKHQQTIYFDYVEDLQLFFPENCIPEGSYTAFREALETKVDRNRVFFSEAFKALK